MRLRRRTPNDEYRFRKGDKLHILLEQKTQSTMSLAARHRMRLDATLSCSWKVLQVDAQEKLSESQGRPSKMEREACSALSPSGFGSQG